MRFCYTIGGYGPLAQLVERCIRIAEIAGSIPARSTKDVPREAKHGPP